MAGRAQRLRGRNKAARPVPPWCRTERSGLRALAATQAGTRRGPGGVSPCRTETVRRHGPGRACQMLCVIAERPGGAVKAPCSSSWEIPPARRGIPGREELLRGVFVRESRDRLWGHSAAGGYGAGGLQERCEVLVRSKEKTYRAQKPPESKFEPFTPRFAGTRPQMGQARQWPPPHQRGQGAAVCHSRAQCPGCASSSHHLPKHGAGFSPLPCMAHNCRVALQRPRFPVCMTWLVF